jgi:pilus assembly protein CpaF
MRVPEPLAQAAAAPARLPTSFTPAPAAPVAPAAPRDPAAHANGPGAARDFARSGAFNPRASAIAPDATAMSSVGGDVNDEIKFRVHRRLIQELETSRLDRLPPAEARDAVEVGARQILQQEAPGVFGLARDELIAAIVDEVLGLGPIQPLLRDPAISEVMVNAPDVIYYEREGRLYKSPVRFRDNQHIMRIIERIISPLGRRVDEASPMVDARLVDGSRVNVVIPPVAPKAPSITIRKFRQDKMKMADLVAVGSLSPESVRFLEACVHIRRNIIVSGGTGSGKTTMLNALSGSIPESERIVTIEDPAELKLQQEHVITLEARPASLEGKNEVNTRDLVKNALRMRPDRIIVGEVRGGEAFDMLQAMNTGHEGSISTVHANSPRDGLARIENMVLMAGMELPMRAIREQVASAIHVIIQVSRFPDGSRRVTDVTEVTGMEGQMITMQDIFKFAHEGIDEDGRVRGRLQPTGIRPSFDRMFEMAGIQLPPDMYTTTRW